MSTLEVSIKEWWLYINCVYGIITNILQEQILLKYTVWRFQNAGSKIGAIKNLKQEYLVIKKFKTRNNYARLVDVQEHKRNEMMHYFVML